MEPRGAICEYDAKDDRSTLWVSSQGVHMIRPVVADMILKIGSPKLRVRTGDVGGGFGMKIFVHPEYPMVVWASRALKRTVKWIPDRQEAFQSDVQGRDHVSIAEMALDKDAASSAAASRPMPRSAPTSTISASSSRRWPAARCWSACTRRRRST